MRGKITSFALKNLEKEFLLFFPLLVQIWIDGSKIANKCRYGRTKNSYILIGIVAKNNITALSKCLESSRFGLATDGISDESDKLLPILVRHEVHNGLIKISLLDMPDINNGSDANTMFKTLNEVLEMSKFKWDYWVTYSSDNTNSMIKKRNSLLSKIKASQSDEQNIFGVAQKGAQELSANAEDFMIDIYHHFKRSVKRKATFARIHGIYRYSYQSVRKVLKRVTTRCFG